MTTVHVHSRIRCKNAALSVFLLHRTLSAGGLRDRRSRWTIYFISFCYYECIATFSRISYDLTELPYKALHLLVVLVVQAVKGGLTLPI